MYSARKHAIVIPKREAKNQKPKTKHFNLSNLYLSVFDKREYTNYMWTLKISPVVQLILYFSEGYFEARESLAGILLESSCQLTAYFSHTMSLGTSPYTPNDLSSRSDPIIYSPDHDSLHCKKTKK